MRRFITSTILMICLILLPFAVMAGNTDLESDMQKSLAKSGDLVIKLQSKLKFSDSLTSDFESLKNLAQEITATHLLLNERFNDRKEKANSLGTKAAERHAEMINLYNANIAQYIDLLGSIETEEDITFSLLDDLEAYIEEILPKKRLPIFGSLPYKNLSYAAKKPYLDGDIKPAYMGQNRVVEDKDLEGSLEAPLSIEIANHARSLKWNPVSIYEWVKNNVKTQWYWGVMKGAEGTLRQKSGNDADQAALLVALLRASGYASRFVRGVIEFHPDIEKAKELIGITEPRDLVAFFRKAGVPSEPVYYGGLIRNIRMEHIWVETRVPYENYRGSVVDGHGHAWIGLDTSIKAAGYTENEPINIFEEFPISVQRDAYLEEARSQTPMEYLREAVNVHLEQALPGRVYEEALKTRTPVTENMSILPASLQFTAYQITGEYTSLPEDLFHKVQFKASDTDNNELFNVTIETCKLSNKQIVLNYEPDTVDDQEIINSYGGLSNTPSYLVRLRPVIKVGKDRMAVAGDGLPMGANYHLSMDLISPNGTEHVKNTNIVGNLSVIGLVAQDAVLPETGPDTERNAPRLLYEEAIKYIDRWNKSEEELASLLHLGLIRPIPTLVTLGCVMDVSYLLDQPHGMEFKGLYVDADLRAVETTGWVSLPDNAEPKTVFMQYAGLEGSVLESRIMEDAFQVESISTAELLGIANSEGRPIVTIDSSNIDTVLPGLSIAENVKEDITNAINQDMVVTIPESELTYEAWTGIGYIKENPQTGEAGYMLSGMIAGGMTVVPPPDWKMQEFNESFSNAFADEPNIDPDSAYSIVKLQNVAVRRGTVGTTLGEPLMVFVRDENGRPVKGARVKFKVRIGGGKFADNDMSETYAYTGHTGIAEISYTLGEKTSDNPGLWWEQSYTYNQQVGVNIIDAFLDTGEMAKSPFVAYGFPDEPVSMVKIRGGDRTVTPLDLAGFVMVRMEDQFNNPISNLNVVFSVDDGSPYTSCSKPDTATYSAKVVAYNDDCFGQTTPLYGECGSADTSVEVTTGIKGAYSGVFTGGRAGTTYTVFASYAGIIEQFHYNTTNMGSCNGNTPPTYSFNVSLINRADSNGNIINAVAPDTKYPVYLRMFFNVEDHRMVEETFECPQNESRTCDVVYGERIFQNTTDFETKNVSFNGENGQHLGNGVFRKMVPIEAGRNTITINADASIVTPRPGYCRCVDHDAEVFGQHTTGTVVYGVTTHFTEVQDGPEISTIQVLIDEEGYVRSDHILHYRIDPAEYIAGSARLAIYWEGQPIAYYPVDRNENRTGWGTGEIGSGFWFHKESSYEAQIILNAGAEPPFQIKSKRVPIEFAPVYIEKNDPAFPDVDLNSYDYYPALGSKTIVLKCDNPTVIAGKTATAVVTRGQGEITATEQAFIIEEIGEDNVGIARFVLSEPDEKPKPGSKITVKFTVKYKENDKEIVLCETFGTWTVRNNSNVTLKEVIDGKAVFVWDMSNADDHKGVTDEGITKDDDRKVDFVQELFNQVVPRKRSVGDANYNLMAEDGIFNDRVVVAIERFKEHFRVSNTTTESDFRKLMKDYGKPEAEHDIWQNRFIDKMILVGKNHMKEHNTINTRNGDIITGDTGLFELYDNVVKIFIEAMISAAEEYENDRTPFRDRYYNVNNRIRHGVSYSFGGNDTLEQYRNAATNFIHSPNNYRNILNQPVVNTVFAGDSTPVGNPVSHYNEYRGDLGTIDSGRQFTGLFSPEEGIWLNYFSNLNNCIQAVDDPVIRDHHFYPQHWAGIDCSGFVQRVINSADPIISSQAPNIDIIIKVDNLNEYNEYCVGGTKLRRKRTFVMYYFDWFANRRVTKYVPEMNSNSDTWKLLKKGDLLRYVSNTGSHITIMHSDRWGESKFITNGFPNMRYDVIHAFGTNTYHAEFSRKVMITGNDFRNPIGFGRIKLWGN